MVHACQNPECNKLGVKDQFPYCYECNEKIKRGELKLPIDGIVDASTDVPSSAFFGMVFNKAVDYALTYRGETESQDDFLRRGEFIAHLEEYFDDLMTFAMKKKKEYKVT